MRTRVFRLPDLGEGLMDAEVVQWHVGIGDLVGVDQEIVSVETAKAAVDLPCPFAGRVTAVHAQAGTRLPVGEALISISDEATGSPSDPLGQGHDSPAESAPQSPAGEAPRPLIGYGAQPPPRRRRGSPDEAIRVISPVVRRLAHEAGVDLHTIQPGPSGVIRRADVEAALASPDADPQLIPLDAVTRRMGERLLRSHQQIPAVTTWVDVDATQLLRTRRALRRAHPDANIGLMALLARIVVAGLTTYPILNATIDVEAGRIRQHSQINLGLAMQTPRGLMVPVIRGAHQLSLRQWAAAVRGLGDRARQGRLSPAELTGGTFTLNNYGCYGVDGATPLIIPGEVGMLGIGQIAEKPWVHQHQVKPRQVTQLSFTFDHRVCDGATAGAFVRYVADRVQDPRALLIDL